MYSTIQDRVFWIYFIITLFFVILGIGSILSSEDPQVIIICIIWLIAGIFLMIVTYKASLNWGPTDVCVVDPNSRCFEPDNRVWLFINVIFIALLILSLLWAGELRNEDGSPLRTMSGVIILLGGILLCYLVIGPNNGTTGNIYLSSYFEFWIAVAYILIWFILTLYVIINTN